MDRIFLEGQLKITCYGLAAGLAFTPALFAQRLASITGSAFDSLHNRPLIGAIVTVVPNSKMVVTDSGGKFRIDSVPFGSLEIFLQHDATDALGISGLRVTVRVDSNARQVFVALPSFATLWRTACGRAVPAGDSGLVFGTVRSQSRNRRPYHVSATWVDLTFDKNVGLGRKGWKMETISDSVGNYALCGVPMFTSLSVLATADSLPAEWTDAGAVERDRILRRDLEIPDYGVGRAVKGAKLRARITDSAGSVLANAEVAIPEIGLTALSDERGEIVFDSVDPGRRLVAVKRIGFAPLDRMVSFSPGRSVNEVFVLSRITILDSVNVKARSGPRDEAMRLFAENQKRGFGRFVTRTELEKHSGQKLTNVMAQLEGIFVKRGRGGQAWVTARRQPKRPACLSGYIGPPPPGRGIDPKYITCARAAGFYLPDEGEVAMGMPLACYSLVYIDGVVQNQTREPFDLNSMNVDDIEGVEWYSGVTQIPIQYMRGYGNCGVLVLYTRWRGREFPG